MKVYVLKKLKNRKYDSNNLLKKILLEEELTDYEVNRNDKGLPYFVAPHHGITINISLSHTKNYWVCAICENDSVGIDIEELGREVNKGIVRKLHLYEQEYLKALSAGSREWRDEFLSVWTRKESYIKYLGTGLSEGLSSFSVVSQEGEILDSITSKNGEILYISSLYLTSSLCASICTSSSDLRPFIITFKDSGLPFKPVLEQATDILSVRDYSLKGLAKKLVGKGHSIEDAYAAAEDLKDRGYIDDVSYATRYIEYSLKKGKGKYRIIRELKGKGVEEDIVKEILINVSTKEGQSESERAFVQAMNLLGYSQDMYDNYEITPPTQKELNKVGRRLSTLGYEHCVIYEIIDRLRS